MSHVQKILVATDFSEQAARAECRAAALCRQLNLDRLELLNVQRIGFGGMLDRAWHRRLAHADGAPAERSRQKLKTTVERICTSQGIRCDYGVGFGEVVPAVLAASACKAVDMIAVGDSNRNGFEKLLGTTAEKLIRRSSRPILLARMEPRQSYRKVLVGIDFSPASSRAARLALAIAPDADIVFLHAYSFWAEGKMRLAGLDDDTIDAYRIRFGVQARHTLNRFIGDLGIDRRLVSGIVQAGAAAPVIASFAKKMEPDLIVMGKRSGSRAEEFLMGSVVMRTIHQTTCDVLVVPKQEADAG